MGAVRKSGVEKDFRSKLITDEQEFPCGQVNDCKAEMAAQRFEVRLLFGMETENDLRGGGVQWEAEAVAEVATVCQKAMESADGVFGGGDGVAFNAPTVAAEGV